MNLSLSKEEIKSLYRDILAFAEMGKELHYSKKDIDDLEGVRYFKNKIRCNNHEKELFKINYILKEDDPESFIEIIRYEGMDIKEARKLFLRKSVLPRYTFGCSGRRYTAGYRFFKMSWGCICKHSVSLDV